MHRGYYWHKESPDSVTLKLETKGLVTTKEVYYKCPKGTQANWNKDFPDDVTLQIKKDNYLTRGR